MSPFGSPSACSEISVRKPLGIAALGVALSEREMDALMPVFDRRGGGELTFREFYGAVATHRHAVVVIDIFTNGLLN